MPAAGRLVDRRPSLGADELLARFVPPPRFADVRFSTYRPDPAHPSQGDALTAMEGAREQSASRASSSFVVRVRSNENGRSASTLHFGHGWRRHGPRRATIDAEDEHS